MKDFAHLHTHNNFGSMLDALQSVDDLFDLVKLKGQKALAVTDHGTLAAHFDAYKAYKRTGIKFIPGCEQYFVHSYDIIEPEAGKKGRKRTEKRKHIVLLSQNEKGYKNLLKINYIGFQHFVVSMGRVFPRISWEVLEEYNEGIIATSACGNGILAKFIFEDKYDEAVKYATKLANIFKDRFYLEIQPHDLKDDYFSQIKLNNNLIKMSKELELPLVVATDAHYLTKEDAKVHDVLMAINSKKPVDDPDRHRYGIDEFYVKDGDEVYDFLLKHHGIEVAEEAVLNTIKIVDRCDNPDYLESKENHLPIFDPSKEKDFEEFMKWRRKSNIPEDLSQDKAYMRFHIIKGFKKKFGHFNKEERTKRWNRIKKELKILEGNNFSSYMLITEDMINWAKNNNILVGIGRGCTTKETKVLTQNGFKNINEVNIGEKVYTHTGNIKEVLDVFKYDIDEDCVSISTQYSCGQLVFTKNHRLLVSKKMETKEGKLHRLYGSHKNYTHHIRGDNLKWIGAGEIEAGDFLFTPAIKRTIIKPKSIDLSQFANDKYTIRSRYISKEYYKNRSVSNINISKNTKLSLKTIAKYKRSSIRNEKIYSYLQTLGISYENWTKEKDIVKYKRFIPANKDFYYILGRWIGDGTYKSDKNYSYYISFSCNIKDSGIDRIHNFFDNLGFVCKKYIKGNCVEICIYDKILVNLFNSLFPEYKKTSDTKYLGFFRCLPNTLLRSLIEGLIDSDGYRRGKTSTIITSSNRLMFEIREALIYLNTPSSVIFRKGGEWKVDDKIYNRKDAYSIEFSLNLISNVRKRNIRKDGFFSKVLQVSNVKPNKVFDISVEDDFSYITQNYASHNSVGGSMIAYLLGIHGVDPLDYGLLFERFQNAHKKDLPDIDTDFTSSGRDKVQEYVREKYGRDHCAQVSNINTYTPKNVIPDLVKSMRNVMPGLIPEGTNYVKVAEAIKAAIPEQDKDGKKVKTLERAMELSPILKNFADRCPELMEYADKIVGMPKEYSTHAAGMVVSDIPIFDFAPLRIDKNNEIAVQYEKNRCEEEGLVKMDFLAISTLDIIDESFKNIRNLGIENAPSQMEDIPINDIDTYNMIQKGQTKCVFQLGKSGIMAILCKKIKPNNILDIAIINALGRPAAAAKDGIKGTRDEYIDRRIGKKDITYPHESLSGPLGETYGLAITEEQLMSIAGEVAGWDLNKADKLRKFTKIKGKDPDFALKLEAEFIEGMMQTHKVEYELAKEVWDKYVSGFGGYGFNKSHAVFYSINGYITAYLKCHYPAAFLAAYLKVKTAKGGISRDDEINGAKAECRRLGVTIIPPDINKSKSGYEVLDEKTIVMGLAAIKGMGDKALDEIIKKQPFSSFVDFLYRVDGRIINKSKIEALSKAGCFDSLDVNRKDIHDEGKKVRDKMNTFLRKKIKDGYDVDMVIDEFPFKLSGNEWSKQEKLRYEQEVLGELVSGNINDLFPNFFTKNNITYISRLKNLPNRHVILIEVIIKAFLREFKIKNGRSAGKLMGKYLIEDVMGSDVELTLWPEDYAKYKNHMKIGKPARISCEVSDYNGTKTLILKEVINIYEN